MSSGGNTAALERQLKKIYDCLNIGCNKKAVQEVDRLPKNVRDMTVFKALKSLALIRMYKRRQAFDILSEINPEDDLDEATLQTMTSCYKESVEVGKIVDLYEAASKRKPNDPEIMAHLFMAHVRVFNFKRQKEIALQMYKNFSKKKRLYSFWAIMSLVMQSQEAKGTCPQDTPDRRVCLSLAEKMCEKMMDDERTHEEIELYLMILRKQTKHEEEYRFLTGPICLRITDHLSWFNRRRAYLCLDLKMYSRAFKHYFPTLIQEYPDQIEYYQGLFRSAFLLDTEAPSQQQPVAINDQQSQASSQSTGTPVKSASALAECYDIVEKQCQFALESCDSTKDQQKGKNQTASKSLSRTSSLNPNRQRLLRGPFIARIELYHTILSNENTLPKNVFNQCKNQFASKFPGLNFLLLDYFQSFGKKIICYYDMDYMINQYKLSEQEKGELVKSVKNCICDIKNNQTDLSSYDYFHMLLNCHMLEHSLKNYKIRDTREQRLKLAKEYIDLYDANRSLGMNTNITEFLPVDHYCLLAINSVMTNSVSLDKFDSQSIISDSVLISLIVMTEAAISNSPSNHQLKLILLKLYSFIGASKQSSEVLLSLGIKHFQIDTLGHLLNPVLYNTGNYSLSRESLETCLEFYGHGVRECLEGLTTSYRDGRFSKIEEISNVLRRLCDSLNATQCVLLKGIVANLNAATLDELNIACQSFDSFKGLHRMFRCLDCVETIKDSRDFKVLKSLHMETNELVQKRQQETLNDEELWLRLRYCLLRSVYIQLECFGTPEQKGGEHANNIDELKFGLNEVETLVPKIQDAATSGSNDDKRYSYLEPESSPFRWKHIDFDSLVALVKPLVFCSHTQSLTSQIQENFGQHLDAIVNNLENQLPAINSLVTMKQALLSLTISVEFISLCVTSLVSIVQIESNSTNSANTQAKVPSSQQPQQFPSKSKSIPHQMIHKMEVQLTKIHNLIKSVDPKSLILDRVTKLEDILLSDQGHTSLETKGGSQLHPLMGQSASQVIFPKIKEKILDSYCESLREIESTCRRKVLLLASSMRLIRGKT